MVTSSTYLLHAVNTALFVLVSTSNVQSTHARLAWTGVTEIANVQQELKSGVLAPVISASRRLRSGADFGTVVIVIACHWIERYQTGESLEWHLKSEPGVHDAFTPGIVVSLTSKRPRGFEIIRFNYLGIEFGKLRLKEGSV